MFRPSPARLARRPRRAAPRTALALAASLLVNGAALAALAAAGAFTLPSRSARVALALVSPEAWEANRRVENGASTSAPPATPAAAPSPAAAPPVPAPPVPAGRIVEVAPSSDPRRPAQARFLAERDNTVPRDVQYRGHVPERRAPVALRPTGGAPGGGIPLPGEEGTHDEAAPGREGALADDQAAAQRIAAARLALAADGEVSAAPRVAVASGLGAPGDGGARRIGRFDPRLLPVGEGFAGAGGGRPTSERLPGVEEGDATRLNTRAFKFADFYRRVAEAIRSEWDPNRAWDGLDPHDRIYGRAARRVAVDIILDRAGRLVDAKVATSSGLAFFDREALRAIDAAAPFPNPPAGLVDAEGHVVLAAYGLRFEFPEHAFIDRLMGAAGR
jgi:TonB family protein